MRKTTKSLKLQESSEEFEDLELDFLKFRFDEPEVQKFTEEETKTALDEKTGNINSDSINTLSVKRKRPLELTPKIEPVIILDTMKKS